METGQLLPKEYKDPAAVKLKSMPSVHMSEIHDAKTLVKMPISVATNDPVKTLESIARSGGVITLRGKSSVMHYRPVKKLGEGGCGVAYRAVSADSELQTPDVALKISLTQDPILKRALQEEISVTKDVKHKQIVPLSMAATCDQTKTLVAVYPFVNGLDLHDYQDELRKQALFTPSILLGFIGMRLFQPLAYMSRKGVAHQDICDHNTMIDMDDGLLRILDFGMAKANLDQLGKALPIVMRDENGKEFAAIFGKPQYTSPAKFHLTKGVPFDFAKEDVYAACTLLYALALNTYPYPLDLPARLPLLDKAPLRKYEYSRYRDLKIQLGKNRGIVSPRDIRPDIPEVLNDIIMDGLNVVYDEQGKPNLNKVPNARQMNERIVKYVFSEFWGLGVQDATLTRYLNQVVRPKGSNASESVRGDNYLRPMAFANHYEQAAKGSVDVRRLKRVGGRLIRTTQKKEVTQIEHSGIPVDYSVAALRPSVERLCSDVMTKVWCQTHNKQPSSDWHKTWEYIVDRKRKQLSCAKMDDSRASAVNTLYAQYINSIDMYPRREK